MCVWGRRALPGAVGPLETPGQQPQQTRPFHLEEVTLQGDWGLWASFKWACPDELRMITGQDLATWAGPWLRCFLRSGNPLSPPEMAGENCQAFLLACSFPFGVGMAGAGQPGVAEHLPVTSLWGGWELLMKPMTGPLYCFQAGNVKGVTPHPLCTKCRI